MPELKRTLGLWSAAAVSRLYDRGCNRVHRVCRIPPLFQRASSRNGCTHHGGMFSPELRAECGKKGAAPPEPRRHPLKRDRHKDSRYCNNSLCDERYETNDPRGNPGRHEDTRAYGRSGAKAHEYELPERLCIASFFHGSSVGFWYFTVSFCKKYGVSGQVAPVHPHRTIRGTSAHPCLRPHTTILFRVHR